MVIARSHEASTAVGRETERLKPVAKAIPGMASEPTGRNMCEHNVASKFFLTPVAEHLSNLRKRNVRPDTGSYDRAHWRGIGDGMLAKDMWRYWRNPNRPAEKPAENGWFYNLRKGNEPEDGRVTDGLVVARRRGNSLGAKEPY